MRSSIIPPTLIGAALLLMGMLSGPAATTEYHARYMNCRDTLTLRLEELAADIRQHERWSPERKDRLRERIHAARTAMKRFDLWARYLDPINYRRINGPLPVEWETEVFEKHEKPYRREGAGLTLVELQLDEADSSGDGLLPLVEAAILAMGTYRADSVTSRLATPDHFLFCNRLSLLNLSAIYTTGFECPDTARVIPELRGLLHDLKASIDAFNSSFPQAAYDPEYRERLSATIVFADAQPDDYSRFDHYHFLRAHVGPLFAMAQEHIRRTSARSRSWMDYSLNNDARDLFAKDLYIGQDAKGLFRRVDDAGTLAEIRSLGEKLFFDPILSGNNERSCASCHEPDMCFTDTTRATPLAFDHRGSLERNAPSLVNADLNHLIMVDGEHINLQAQALDVITDPREMGARRDEILNKVLACPDYRKPFTRLLKHTPTRPALTLDHLLSAITIYYTSFSTYPSAFDLAMSTNTVPDPDVVNGFNLFMSRAQCATCHFPPHFNGVKPPYIGSEFEVIGVPQDTAYTALSADPGRSGIHMADETHHAFRTGALRNIARSAPYMHNGVFRTLRQVIDLYDGGGGAGRGLDVPNQTLSSDQLHLSDDDKSDIEAFLRSLNEELPRVDPPASLPRSTDARLNTRRSGGTY